MDQTFSAADRERGQAARRAAALLTVEQMVQNKDLNVSSTQEAKILDRALKMPRTSVNTYLKGISGNSPKAGIKAFCAMCLGWEDHRVGIRDCTDSACPLYPYRPYQDFKERAKHSEGSKP